MKRVFETCYEVFDLVFTKISSMNHLNTKHMLLVKLLTAKVQIDQSLDTDCANTQQESLCW